MTEILSNEDYAVLAALAIDIDDRLIRILNRNGCANWTVCPECHVDDFAHVEGCSMIKMVAESTGEKNVRCDGCEVLVSFLVNMPEVAAKVLWNSRCNDSVRNQFYNEYLARKRSAAEQIAEPD